MLHRNKGKYMSFNSVIDWVFVIQIITLHNWLLYCTVIIVIRLVIVTTADPFVGLASAV